MQVLSEVLVPSLVAFNGARTFHSKHKTKISFLSIVCLAWREFFKGVIGQKVVALAITKERVAVGSSERHAAVKADQVAKHFINNVTDMGSIVVGIVIASDHNCKAAAHFFRLVRVMAVMIAESTAHRFGHSGITAGGIRVVIPLSGITLERVGVGRGRHRKA